MEKHGVTIFEDWVWANQNHNIWILKNLADYVPALNNKQWKVRISLQVTEKTEEGDGEEFINLNVREYNGNYKDITPVCTSYTLGKKAEIECYTDEDAKIEIKFDFDIDEARKRKAKLVLENSID